MSTATKLEYLNETKSKIKDNINLTGAGLTNQTPFRQYATDLKTALLNILNNGIDSLYNNFPKTTGTGTNITLNNTLQAPIRSVINGDTEQNGTPTPDNPVEIQSVTGLQKVSVGGKNLLDISYYAQGSIDATTGQNISNSQNGRGNNYISVQPNTTYTISTKNNVSQLRLSEYTNKKVNIQRDSVINNKVLTITTTENTYYLRWSFNYDNVSTVTETIVNSLDLQLEKGSTATTYEPYQSQEYEINLGKNLFTLQNISSGTNLGVERIINNSQLTLNGTTTSAGGVIGRVSTGITLEAGTYNVSIRRSNGNSVVPSGKAGALYFRKPNGTVLKDINLSSFNYESYYYTSSLTLDEDTLLYLEIYCNTENYEFNNLTLQFQLEKGTEATSYSPYFTPIHLYEGDQIIGTPYNWSIKHVMGEVVLDGSENWADRPNYTYADRFVYGGSIERIANVGYSNYFQIKTVSSNDYPYLSINGSQTVINFSEKGTTTLAQFKTWLSTHNTKVVYELAEPTTEPITNTELIEDLNNFYNAKSYNGQTNISVEGDLSMILSVSALKGDTQ